MKMVFRIIIFVALLSLCQTWNFCKNFERVTIAPSSSCHKVTKPTPTIGNRFQSCIERVGLLYMVSQHVITNECFCCQLPLSQSEGEPGEWRSFVPRCPDGYTGFVFETRVTCLRFDSTWTNYHNASLQCQSEDGDLVRIENPGMIPLLKNRFYSDFFPVLERPPQWGFWVSFYLTPVIVVLGLTGNTLCFVVMKRKALRTRSYSHFLCALAVFDSITLIGRQVDLLNEYLNKHTQIGNMFSTFSDIGCKIYFFSLNICYLMSAWLIVCMTIERLQAVCFPFKKTPWRTQTGAVSIILGLLLLLSLSQFFRFTYFGRSGRQCGAYVQHRAAYIHWHIYGYMFTLLFGLPFSIVLVGNFSVLLTIHQIRKEIRDRRFQRKPDVRVPKIAIRKRSFKTTATLLSISFSYIISMLPLLIISVVLHVMIDLNTVEGIRMYIHLKPYSEVISTFSYINYSINFCIYVLSGKFFRRELDRMFQHQRKSSSQNTGLGMRETRDDVVRLIGAVKSTQSSKRITEV